MSYAEVWSGIRCRIMGWLITPFLALRNRLSGEPVVGSSAVVVSLTSYGRRIRTVHLAIESIARGTIRPQRLILWLDDAQAVSHPPAGLRRLQQRGLEIAHTEDVRSHKKYYPYVQTTPKHLLPLVTADDDVLYPRSWLEELWTAWNVAPDCVWCVRGRVAQIDPAGRFRPYADWPLARVTRPAHSIVPTGTSGVLYPPSVLDALRRAGDAFRALAPDTDDLWLHHVALVAGVRAGQVTSHARHFPVLPFGQGHGLFRSNVSEGNDAVLDRLYTASDRGSLAVESPGD
jgi:hypothetical protein